MLRLEEPQSSIQSQGVTVCYLVFGENPPGDVILGHYPRGINQRTAIYLAKLLVEQQNQAYERQLNFDDFAFKFIDGPTKPKEIPVTLRIPYANAAYHRGSGLRVTENEMRIKSVDGGLARILRQYS